MRDPEFRSWMIENHWDEDLCRRWDALADEDHTHHLTRQEYSLFQSDWWLHSNKQGCNRRKYLNSNKHCQPRIDCNEKQKETNKCLLTLTEVNTGHRVLLLRVELARSKGGLLILQKVTMEMHQVLKERGDLLNCSIWKDSSGQDFSEFNSLFF